MYRSEARTVVRAAVAAGALWLGAALPLAAEDGLTLKVTAYKQAVAENIADDDRIGAFYRARDFAPIWTGAGEEDRARRLALMEAFSLADDHGLPSGRYDPERLMRRLSQATDGRSRGLLEIELTRTFIQFANDLQSGILEPGKIVEGIKRDLPRRDPDMLLTRLTQEDPRAVFLSLVPSSPEYTRLMRAKLRLEHKINHGGWGPTVPGGSLRPGNSGNAVVALRNRLTAMGYMKPSLSMTYDAEMEAAVREFQEDHAIEADGIAGSGTLRAINVGPEERLKSIMVAMERERWLNLPDGRGKRHILVNLVDFHAQIIDDDKLTFETRSVIGAQGRDRRTPEFSDVMELVVINPYWFIPQSIIRGEYLPAIRSNPYAAGHLEIVDYRGRVVSRETAAAYANSGSFPFTMRQRPGPSNALGSVKFLFPNKYNIYLHDTPSQHLFKREVRTFSHGCIRLDDPHEFAYELLSKQVDDAEAYFKRIHRSGENTRIPLEEPVPVHLIYRTAFTKAKGQMNYRNDVYGRDELLWRALSNEGVALRVGRS
ncbi:L,D-transpeptidase family protein [Mameliella sediminis]|uniref:L,D-transpeptidase family protein n=1 Tax=Mameliella sediminis TaxID=2836866 RepID=UPI001C489AAE|nr:L,D-transpeptidase family protein [Mameliella sediminis]MBY6115634.1 L,D-transpeptidase family protein [Antarctobacter heliothermus]MBY6145881.1 L,D-transpeptidase family protein [Mameliella alba]MBV7393398.1 L,D-transpeptidase family protein [Mameliella sediminis]MBY6161203.1 L,D-transpeptidase family protein [Mameliella alba]MBY6169673.1 L,D-transpeptidase family protein [Mameliella alba]